MVSLIIPTYNKREVLPDTMNSMVSLRDKERVELIVTDDGSTDGTAEYLTQWFHLHAAEFGGAVLKLNPVNLGTSANHGCGFALATCEYGVYIGCDDYIENPNFPRELEEALAHRPGLAMGRTDVEAFDRPRNLRYRVFSHHGSFFRADARGQFVLLSTYEGSVVQCGPGTVIHLPTLRQLPLAFDPRHRVCEDVILQTHFLVTGRRIEFLPVKGIVWVRSPWGRSYGDLNRFDGYQEEMELWRREQVRPHRHWLTPWERILVLLLKMPRPIKIWGWLLSPFGLKYRMGVFLRRILPLRSPHGIQN